MSYVMGNFPFIPNFLNVWFFFQSLTQHLNYLKRTEVVFLSLICSVFHFMISKTILACWLFTPPDFYQYLLLIRRPVLLITFQTRTIYQHFMCINASSYWHWQNKLILDGVQLPVLHASTRFWFLPELITSYHYFRKWLRVSLIWW